MLGLATSILPLLLASAVSQPGGTVAANVAAPAAPAAGGESSDLVPAPDVYGLYPIWEETGAVESSLSARIGFGHAQVGLGPLTIGTQPFLDLYRTPNAYAKLGLLRSGRVRLALFGRVHSLPTAAEQQGLGTVNASTFANPFAPVTLLASGAAVSWIVRPTLHAHASATILNVRSPDADYRSVSAGLAGFVEWFATPHRSVRLHAGTEGWPVSGQSHVGLSFGWQSRYLALSAGYARRFDPGDTSSGVVMLDGALKFP